MVRSQILALSSKIQEYGVLLSGPNNETVPAAFMEGSILTRSFLRCFYLDSASLQRKAGHISWFTLGA
ncbi:hypothetical protein PISMIDRAFT_681292 [Pisolithus microcarpus 441]|uniref:Uncharacterized protein n=1 Tax=Pisolithus microcarpus 441 TaxID=765257 RepID=A0A0C9YX66_9AGAM|nr:hypothetical protein PISMIDRAFT_681292 [Pisolithus microcarpus 441]